VLLGLFSGTVSGLVGAGGNLGAVCWGFLFKGVGNTVDSFGYLALIVFVCSFLSFFVKIQGQSMVCVLNRK
jgi:NNP family nitrate/nitrite transporter-like MFS transporter